MTEELISNELIETTYNYCFKRLNNSEDAKDLAQDILLEAIKALKRKKEIKHFYSWYWKLAHNRFCMFLNMKENKAVCIDTYIDTLKDEKPNSIDDFIKMDEISEINYAISKLSKIHRQIIVYFYLKEMKISEIASDLNLPEGTVKRRLYDAKKSIRKEVVNMQSYGKGSYVPTKINIWGCYELPKYWNRISEIMAEQILFTCSDKGKSISQIANEIGVAPLYFEEKLQYLLENKFIKETSKGLYLTDFCMIPEQKYNDFEYEVSLVYKSIGTEITNLIMQYQEQICNLNFYGNDFDFKYLLWLLYVYACDELGDMMLTMNCEKWADKVPKNNGKDYRIAASFILPEERIRNHDCKQVAWSNLHNHYQTADYRTVCYANLYQTEPFNNRDYYISERNIDTVMRIYENPFLELTEVQEEQVTILLSQGLMKRREKGLFLTIPVISFDVFDEIKHIYHNTLMPIVSKYYNRISEIGDKMLLPYIRQDLIEEYANWIIKDGFCPLKYVMYYGQFEGKTLEIPEDYSVSGAGLCLYYRK